MEIGMALRGGSGRRFSYGFAVAASRILGYQYGHSRAYSQENAQEHFHGLGAGAHGGKGDRIAEITDDQGVHGSI